MSLMTQISIFCRIKPSTINESQEIQKYSITHLNENDLLSITNKQVNSLTLNHKHNCCKFQFSKVFDQTVSQKSIYDAVAKPIVKSVLDGYNGTIFAYGQTGSGKTYTISGEKENYGIVPRALLDILTFTVSDKSKKFEIKMSYLEIYNEQGKDLLNQDDKKKVSLWENGDKVFEWHNLTICSVASFSEAMELFESAHRNRIVANTPMNASSSRSHTILTIYLTSKTEPGLEVRKSKLNIVDLAGSERLNKINDNGTVLEETRFINLSLHYLQQVIIALTKNSRSHVPYRNCSLTAALKDSLGGNCMTAMVANISLDKANLEETISTCRFSQRVAMVYNEVSINIDLEQDLHEESSRLMNEIDRLESKFDALQAKTKVRKNETVGKDKGEELPAETHKLSIRQLLADIVYMIGWIQDEIKFKQNEIAMGNDIDSSLSMCNILGEIDENDDFNEFVLTVEEKENWINFNEEVNKAKEHLSAKVDIIRCVQQEILSCWKYHEKSLLEEILGNRTLHLPIPEANYSPQLTPTSNAHGFIFEKLLLTHSDLLKDIQLLKSGIHTLKINMLKIKQKYLVEYSNWEKLEKISIENFKTSVSIRDLKSLDDQATRKKEFFKCPDEKKFLESTDYGDNPKEYFKNTTPSLTSNILTFCKSDLIAKTHLPLDAPSMNIQQREIG